MFEKKITDEEKKQLEKEAKKAKKEQKRKDKGKDESQLVSTLKSLVIPFILTVAVVVGLYFVLKYNATADEILATTVITKQDIKANTFISEEQIGNYFEEVAMDVEYIPDTSYATLKSLPNGFYVENQMAKKQMLLKDDVEEHDIVMDKYKNSVRTSISVNAFDNSVSGSLRKGDIVDIYALDPITEALTLMVSGVYIESVYNSSGDQILEDGVATVFTILVAPGEVEAINQAITYGGIQLYLTQE